METVVYDDWYLREQAERAKRRAARARPPAAPRRRVLDRREPCPRKALAAVVATAGQGDYAGLSRMLDRHESYLARFVREGIPAALTERDHQLLADHFGLDHRGLGVRDLWAVRS